MALYQFGKAAILNNMESRIHQLYQFLDKGIMPWMWDYEHYTGDNADMVGLFYPEDINAIVGIEYFENHNESGSRNDMAKLMGRKHE